MLEILIDTGGTFTDGVLIDDKKSLTVAKVATLPADAAKSILNCIAQLAEKQQMTKEDLLKRTSSVTVGTTLPTNSILEGKGAKCCLIHTKGFRDVFELGRNIPKKDIFNLKMDPPKILIPRYLRFGVEERMQYEGSVVTPLNEDDVRKAVEKAKENGVEVPVVCFLHSYINPVHEEMAAEIIKEDYPNVVISSKIVRRWIEFDRANTATCAAYVKPNLTRFLKNLKELLKDAKFKGALLFTTGFGNITTPELAEENPATLIGSGLATGVLFGRFLAEISDFDNVISMDMGGTSLDIGVLYNRTVSTTTEMVMGDQKIALETVDVATIGAGGGSIACIDRTGVLRVGPQSAGADPGPACYGKGGQEPTITDADVVLGYIPTDFFLGGTTPLKKDLAERAIDEKVARPLDRDLMEAAYMIATLAEVTIAEKVFFTVVEKGYDPRNFVLLAGGGAGPVHGVAVAKRLGMKRVYIPKHSGVFSALGVWVAELGYVFNRFHGKRDDEATADALKDIYQIMEKEGVEIFTQQGIGEKDMTVIRGAEIRYFGQLRDISVWLPETVLSNPFTETTYEELVSSFHKRHKELYGHSNPKLPVSINILKLQVVRRGHSFHLAKQPLNGKDSSKALKRKRQIYWKEQGGFIETPCYDGNKLQHGNLFAGPAIIEEKETTVVIPPDCEVLVDAYGNYLVNLKG